MTGPGGGWAPAVQWLFLDDTTPAGDLVSWLDATLPHCSWTCHVVVAGSDPRGRILDAVVRHLEREPLALVHLHQVVGDAEPAAAIEPLMTAAERFQAEAYRERTGARLVPLPILDLPADSDPRPLLELAGDLAGRLAKPSLLVSGRPRRATANRAAELGLRLYPVAGRDGDTVLEGLMAAHVLDSVMERLGTEDPLLAPCRPHLVAHGGRVFGCARQWQRRLSDSGLASGAPPVWNPVESLCAGCIADAAAASGPAVTANLRRREGRELALRVSAELVNAGWSAAAAGVSDTAVELSDGETQRSQALVQAALCRLDAGRLADADQALVAAAGSGAPAGLVAYHRAHVQVAWHDDIEALGRFEEALEHGTDVVTRDGLHLEMALSHIRLEEWADARGHLGHAGEPSPDVAFNLGVCDLNEGRAGPALNHFDRALELEPNPDDVGRVRFFRGYCLKELERWDEAVGDLERSIELETPEPAHHNLLGFCLFKLGRHAEAVECFERAVHLDPTSAVDWANIGVNLERLGEIGRAAELYRKALGMDPLIGFAAEGLERLEGK